MSDSSPRPGPRHGVFRRLLPVIAFVAMAAGAYALIGYDGVSLEALVNHRMAIDEFVQAHNVLAVLAFVALYIVVVATSVPGGLVLTVMGGFLFGLTIGVAASVVGATIGATIVFLVARTAIGEPLMRRAGPRLAKLAQGFRSDAFSYLLFLRLVPAFPFFLVNLVPAFAGVKLWPFIAATTIGVIPASIVFALAGLGLDSVIDAQSGAYRACLAAGRSDCRMHFDPWDVLTPQLIAALVALGLLALMPVVLKRWRASPHATL